MFPSWSVSCRCLLLSWFIIEPASQCFSPSILYFKLLKKQIPFTSVGFQYSSHRSYFDCFHFWHMPPKFPSAWRASPIRFCGGSCSPGLQFPWAERPGGVLRPTPWAWASPQPLAHSPWGCVPTTGGIAQRVSRSPPEISFRLKP